MADPKKLVEDAAAQAMLAAGKDAAKRAALDLLSSPEERAASEAEASRASTKRRRKLYAGAVLGLFVLIGVVGMLVSYWQWFLLLGVLGFAGLFGWRRIKRRLAQGRTPPARIEVAAVKEPLSSREAPRREAEEREREAKAVAEAEAMQEQEEVEDELEAMKARVKRARSGPGGG